MDYFAHKRYNSDGTIEYQYLIDHLESVGIRAADFAKQFSHPGKFKSVTGGACKDAYNAGLLHDIGKYSDEFQQRIKGAPGVPDDHSTAGAVEYIRALEMQQNQGRSSGVLPPVAFAVAGHHTGLPDGGNKIDSAGDATMRGRLKKQLPPYADYNKEVAFAVNKIFQDVIHATPLSFSLYTRMLYSCLVDADYLDTEEFMRGNRGNFSVIPPAGFLNKLNYYYDNWQKEDNYLNRIRDEVKEDCANASSQSPGLFTLTVPTGGGKTLSSMIFALKHAVQHEKRRVIYVIPYTSIIDQTAMVLRSVFGQEGVLEHHSGIDYETRKDLTSKHLLATENWDAPIVLTTFVQFFESCFANKSSRCRKLHNIANSVIIFDEAQTMPVPFTEPCVAAIAELVHNYKCTAVLCTATQPALEERFKKLNLTSREIIKPGRDLHNRLKRASIKTYKKGEKVTVKHIANVLSKREQVLCIVNKRQSAQEIYELLPPDGSYCLTTLIYPEHRKRILKEIHERLKEGKPCRVVSTSLIEAGVDIDFPVVYRDIAGLDSVVQSAGRCNREGKRPLRSSITYVFRLINGSTHFSAKGAIVFERLAQKYKDVSSPEAIAEYFKIWREYMQKDSLDKEEILPAFQKGIAGNHLPFATVAERFKLIDDMTQTVYIPIGEGRKIIDQVRQGQINRFIYRRLGLYGVSVYEKEYVELLASGSAEIIPKTEICVLRDISLYDKNVGLKSLLKP